MQKRIAVIPARGGSTRLKDKNIYPLGDKPLIRWTVEAVVKSNAFHKIIVSTDSDKIFDAVSDLPVERHTRPSVHATVKSTALNAMINLMENYPEKHDVFAYFLPTCPFVSPEDIRDGVAMLDEDTDFVVSMTNYTEPIQLACVMKDEWVMPIFDNLECGLTNSKFIKSYVKPSGAFYMGKWDKIIEHQNFFKGRVKGVVIEEKNAVDINTLSDIMYAESLLKMNLSEKKS